MAINQDLLNKVNAYMNNPKARAVLDMIARSEGTASLGDNGYNVRFGGTLFSDFSVSSYAVKIPPGPAPIISTS